MMSTPINKIRTAKQRQIEGIMMILSPAKTLDLSPFALGNYHPELGDKSDNLLTNPCCDAKKTSHLATVMKKQSPTQLMKLLKISSKLANVSHEYWNSFDDKNSTFPVKPALYAFSGPAYQGINVKEMNYEHLLYLQDNLIIIDPLYGTLRPLDQIQPYRLEMATKNVTKNISNLAKWWTDSVTSSLSTSLEKRHTDPILLNLASDEYSAAVDPKQLPPNTNYIKVIFRQEGKVISVHAKRARGLMVRYVAENQIDSLEGVKQFDWEGYKIVGKEDSSDQIVFDRKKQTAKAGNKRKATTDTKQKTTSRKK